MEEKGNTLQNLKFRRQFLLSANRCDVLNNWQQKTVGQQFLYVHPDCEVTETKHLLGKLILIGYAIDPRYPDKSNEEIINSISTFKNLEEIPGFLYGLAGRFVLLVSIDKNMAIFNDACGLRSVFFTKNEDEFYAASQPTLLKLAQPLKKGKKYKEYYSSNYVKSDSEHYFPGGISLYDNVHHLLPNYYLDVTKFEQIRFYPNSPLISLDMETGLKKAADLIRNSMLAASKRFKLAVTLTAGWDSRLVLSSCKDISNDIFFYTLKYRDLNKKSPDIKIPGKLLSKLGLKHHIIDCKKPVDNTFIKIYGENTDMPHIDDWGYIANGMFSEYPSERVVVKGNCGEIARGYYKLPKVNTKDFLDDFLLNTNGNWRHISFCKNQIESWIIDVRQKPEKLGYQLMDLYFWEHRMGAWQAQSQLEWDIVQEVFTPFNNRELMDILLGVEAELRGEPDFIFFRRLMEELWPEVLLEPLNPKTSIQKLKSSVRFVINTLGLESLYKKIQ